MLVLLFRTEGKFYKDRGESIKIFPLSRKGRGEQKAALKGLCAVRGPFEVFKSGHSAQAAQAGTTPTRHDVCSLLDE